jgi:ubiquitin-protein ligase
MSSCLICHESCLAGSNICESVECAAKSSYTYMEDNCVADMINNFREECLLLLKLADSSTTAEISKKVLPVAESIVQKTDRDIIDAYGLNKYQSIKFYLKNALMEFKLVKTSTKEFDVFEFIYSDVVNTNFENASFLFHGSPVCNWYSIIDTGLKVFSKTPRMRNGSAYGTGIYLSSDLNISYKYSANGNYADVIVGVFEVIGDLGKYRKANYIYVVADETKLRLKYLLRLDNNLSHSLKSISEYFIRDKRNSKLQMNGRVSQMKNKRLLMEIRNIMKKTNDEFSLLEVENTNVWNVLLINVDKDSNLHKDMVKQGVDNIHIEVRFENSYPLSPPFVRVIKPAFKPQTGHITQGGSICAEILTNQGWSPAINMESLLITIKAIISEDGRLGPQKAYTLASAKSSYMNMLSVHGWH